MMTLEEVWENLRQDPEIKATMEEAEKSYKLFKKIENLIVSDLEAKLAKGVEIINEWMQLNFEKSVKINQLEHQIEDKEKEIEELKKGVYKVTLGTTESNQIDFTENFYVIQNQKAIEELEKARNEIKSMPLDHTGHDNYDFEKSTINYCLTKIDQQIKLLKGEK